MATEKQQNLQDVFLNHVRKNKVPVTVFLINGVKLQGVISSFDNFCLLLRRDGHVQLVYKHAVSTVMPSAAVRLTSRRPKSSSAAGLTRHVRHHPRLTLAAAGGGRAWVLSPLRARQRRCSHARRASLAEAVGLARAIDLEVVRAEAGAVAPEGAGHAVRLGQGQGVRPTALEVEPAELVVVDAALVAGAAAQPRAARGRPRSSTAPA